MQMQVCALNSIEIFPKEIDFPQLLPQHGVFYFIEQQYGIQLVQDENGNDSNYIKYKMLVVGEDNGCIEVPFVGALSIPFNCLFTAINFYHQLPKIQV